MNLIITLTSAGTDTGPFNIYSNVDGYLNAFDTNIDKATLLAGFATSNVPDGTVEIRVQSVNDLCNNYGRAGTIPLEYYFTPAVGAYVVDFYENGSFAYVYGYFNGYYDGSYTVPGNLLVKLNSDRSVDTSFDILEGFNYGVVYLGATIFVQTDGKLILSGFYTSFNGVSANRIIRLNTDGSKDNTFNTGTGFNDYTTKIAVETTTGKMYITGLYSSYNGNSSPRFVRLLADGSRDTSFLVTTGFNNGSQDILINSDGTLYVTGYFSSWNSIYSAPKIIKLNSDGTKDTSFNPGTGLNTGNQPNYMARIESEDNFFVAGYFTAYNGTSYGQIIKLDPTGAVVPTSEFDPGSGFNGDVGVIKVIWNNKLFCTGGAGGGGAFTSYNGTPTVGLVLLNADGSILQAFDTLYTSFYIIGNNVYGQPAIGGENQIIYTYFP